MKPLAIIIMDGFGLGPDGQDNAIARARKPNLECIWKNYATTSLGSSGLSLKRKEELRPMTLRPLI